MNKITIFWIEDNPIIQNVKVDNGIQYPKFLHNDYFEYYLFQHPKQVWEYLSLVNNLTDSGGFSSLAENCPASLPDIVVFDYKLYEAFKRNVNALQYSNQYQRSFLIKSSASHKLKECYEKKLKENDLFLDREVVQLGQYLGDKFKKELGADKIESDDEFGLYCGITIVREFKEYITCGVPATINKADKSTISYNSLFYEWINSYDLKGAIGRLVDDPESKAKNWTDILNFAADLLRKRILYQLQSNKITPNFTQLMQFIEGDFGNRVFTFQSAYGTRHLPLDGLFIDKKQCEERDEAIKSWASKLLKKFKAKEYKTAKVAATKLIKAYQSTVLVNQRIRLSELAVKLCNTETLSRDENEELDELKGVFGINTIEISACVDPEQDAENSNIKLKVRDYRVEKTRNNLTTKRLIVLFTDILLHKARQFFCEKNKNSTIDNGIISTLKEWPTLDDLRFALFPIPKNPMVLPYHQHLISDNRFHKKDPYEVWDSHLSKAKMRSNPLFPKSKYPNNLSVGEKQLCKSFALDIDLSKEYCPGWLTENK